MKDAYEGKTVIVSERVTLESVAITIDEMKNEVSERLTKLEGLPETVRDLHERISEMGTESSGVGPVAEGSPAPKR